MGCKVLPPPPNSSNFHVSFNPRLLCSPNWGGSLLLPSRHWFWSSGLTLKWVYRLQYEHSVLNLFEYSGKLQLEETGWWWEYACQREGASGWLLWPMIMSWDPIFLKYFKIFSHESKTNLQIFQFNFLFNGLKPRNTQTAAGISPYLSFQVFKHKALISYKGYAASFLKVLFYKGYLADQILNINF